MFNSMATRARQMFRSLATISLVSVMATALVIANPATATSAETAPTPTVETTPVPTPTISAPPVPIVNPTPTTTPPDPVVSPTVVWHGNATTFGYNMSNLPAGAKTVISWNKSGVWQSTTTTKNSWWSGTQTGWTTASAKVYSSTGELLYASPVSNPAGVPTTPVPTPAPTTPAPTTPVPTPAPIPPSPEVTVPPVVPTPVATTDPVPPIVTPTQTIPAPTTPVPTPASTLVLTPPVVTPPAPEVTGTPTVPTTAPTTPEEDTTGSDNPKPTPVKPPVKKPVVKMVTRHFQVDTYMPRTKSQARTVANLAKDGKLHYRENRALWGASKWKFVSVRVPTNATKAQVMKAVSSKAGRKFASLSTTAKLKSIKPGQKVTIAWELGKGTKPVFGKAWGPKNKTVQVYLGRSK